ncbi:RNA-dependent RNA polymerase 1 [Ceratocystis fimbriata CBS 114723]|uniref:RNA-dependent RNA polymerase 1 n=1 Tax=Ceratocystis fimbriata CBS 114723 TaxID=1035309 RepID=A0A2C5WX24_9PEZI|nr:RNA-dependent RNA polymerase 1 [Ceratocystis fimbriata CBS 114723]
MTYSGRGKNNVSHDISSGNNRISKSHNGDSHDRAKTTSSNSKKSKKTDPATTSSTARSGPASKSNYANIPLAPAPVPQPRPLYVSALSISPRPTAGWKSWVGALITLIGLPGSANSRQIFTNLSKHGGEISRIEFFASPARSLSLTSGAAPLNQARVIFEKLPNTAFWSSGRLTFRESCDCPNWTVVVMAQEFKMGVSRIKSPVRPEVTYPAIITLKPQSTTFGMMTKHDVLMSMKTIRTDQVDLDCRQAIEIDLPRKQIRVFFGLPRATIKQTSRAYKALISFDNLDAIYYEYGNSSLDFGDQPESSPLFLRLTLQCPPLYFWKRFDTDAISPKRGVSFDMRDSWIRLVNIGMGGDDQETVPLNFHTSSSLPSFIDLGKWRTLRFSLSHMSNRAETLNALRDFRLPLLPEPKPLAIVPRVNNPIWSILDSPANTLPSASKKNNLAILSAMDSSPHKLPWAVRYQLEVCVTRGIFQEHSISQDFINQLAAKGEHEARSLLEQAADLYDRSTASKTLTLIENPYDILAKDSPLLRGSRATARPRIPHYCALVRKAVVTPTTVYFMTPATESTNRVLREFRHVHDHFLRVQFSDELLNGKLNSGNTGHKNNNVYVRIFHIMDQGIRIGDRVFKFLACGNSQIREGGAYFFADTPKITRNDIRAWMGNFSSIRSIAKRTARLGQCFSTTRAIRGVLVPVIYRIPDIERNGFCFTDGVGKISSFLASIIMEEMELFTVPGEPIPAAYQFRMGGCKGVLVVSDDASGMQVHVRKSQEKFHSDFNGLEVIRVSQFSIATLNRQLIVLLSSLGVPDEAFEKLLEDQLTAYKTAMVDLPTAMTLLTQYVDENAITLQIADMARAGFLNKANREPFVLSLMALWRTWSLKLLKEKARIVVPKGAFLLGCVDERGLLRGHSIASEGSKSHDINQLPQIFVRIPEPDPRRRGQYVTIEGICIVGRNPSLHPGDIRVVQAVNVPELNHLTNVIVFPSIGDRDVPSMLSGGDLDGDDFFVIWDETLIPPEWNHRPMAMSPVQSVESNKDIRVCDMQAFFVKYLRDDILPLIAHAHLALADFQGAKSKKCLQLAALHSKAVDFAKSGVPAELPPKLHPKRWPHFMEKKRGSTYHSSRPLGIIYDRVQTTEFTPFYTNDMFESILSQPALPEHLELARQIKINYDIEMRRLMGQFEIATEFEAWSTFVLSKPRVGNAYKMQERIGSEVSVLKRTFRELCVEKVGGVLSFTAVKPLLIAMYHVTHEQLQASLAELRSKAGIEARPGPDADVNAKLSADLDFGNMPLISFPWLFPEYMCQLTSSKDKADDAFTFTQAGADELRLLVKQRRAVVGSTKRESTEAISMEAKSQNIIPTDRFVRAPDTVAPTEDMSAISDPRKSNFPQSFSSVLGSETASSVGLATPILMSPCTNASIGNTNAATASTNTSASDPSGLLDRPLSKTALQTAEALNTSPSAPAKPTLLQKAVPDHSSTLCFNGSNSTSPLAPTTVGSPNHGIANARPGSMAISKAATRDVTKTTAKKIPNGGAMINTSETKSTQNIPRPPLTSPQTPAPICDLLSDFDLDISTSTSKLDFGPVLEPLSSNQAAQTPAHLLDTGENTSVPLLDINNDTPKPLFGSSDLSDVDQPDDTDGGVKLDPQSSSSSTGEKIAATTKPAWKNWLEMEGLL